MIKKCSNCGKYKCNPGGDENLRRLERAALSGDIYAARQLSLEKHRRGLCEDGKDCWQYHCWQCQVNKMQKSNSMTNFNDPAAAALVLGYIGDPAAIPALVDAMQNNSNSGVRLYATWSLGKIGDPAAISALIRAMKYDSYCDVRWYAADALGKIGDPSAIPDLVVAMEKDSNWYVRRRAAAALEKLRPTNKRNPGGDENLRRLERAALSGDIYAARQLSLEKHRRELCGNYGDGCWQCQVEKMQNDPDLNMRASAAEELGKIGDPAAIPALAKAMQGNSSLGARRWIATYALGEIGDPAAIPGLIETMLTDTNTYVRRTAATALGTIGITQAIPALSRAMLDADWGVRWSAIKALEVIGDPSVVPTLIELINNEPDWDVRRVATDTIEKLRTTNKSI